MIVKTLPWKFRGWKRLTGYITRQRRERGAIEICHNFPAAQDIDDIVQHFQENDHYRKARKNGVVLYHEIISFSGDDKPTPAILRDITHHYLDLRAPGAMAFAGVHRDKEHVHVHIMIAGNEYKSAKTTRLSKSRFIEVRTELEKYQEAHYGKELSHSIAYKDKRRKRQRNREYKEKIRRAVEKAVQSSPTLEAAQKKLASAGYALYSYRGKPTGILFQNAKYRFRSLGLDLSTMEPQKLISEPDLNSSQLKDPVAERLKRLETQRQERSPNEPDRSRSGRNRNAR